MGGLRIITMLTGWALFLSGCGLVSKNNTRSAAAIGFSQGTVNEGGDSSSADATAQVSQFDQSKVLQALIAGESQAREDAYEMLITEVTLLGTRLTDLENAFAEHQENITNRVEKLELHIEEKEAGLKALIEEKDSTLRAEMVNDVHEIYGDMATATKSVADMAQAYTNGGMQALMTEIVNQRSAAIEAIDTKFSGEMEAATARISTLESDYAALRADFDAHVASYDAKIAKLEATDANLLQAIADGDAAALEAAKEYTDDLERVLFGDDDSSDPEEQKGLLDHMQADDAKMRTDFTSLKTYLFGTNLDADGNPTDPATAEGKIKDLITKMGADINTAKNAAIAAAESKANKALSDAKAHANGLKATIDGEIDAINVALFGPDLDGTGGLAARITNLESDVNSLLAFKKQAANLYATKDELKAMFKAVTGVKNLSSISVIDEASLVAVLKAANVKNLKETTDAIAATDARIEALASADKDTFFANLQAAVADTNAMLLTAQANVQALVTVIEDRDTAEMGTQLTEAIAERVRMQGQMLAYKTHFGARLEYFKSLYEGHSDATLATWYTDASAAFGKLLDIESELGQYLASRFNQIADLFNNLELYISGVAAAVQGKADALTLTQIASNLREDFKNLKEGQLELFRRMGINESKLKELQKEVDIHSKRLKNLEDQMTEAANFIGIPTQSVQACIDDRTELSAALSLFSGDIPADLEASNHSTDDQAYVNDFLAAQNTVGELLEAIVELRLEVIHTLAPNQFHKVDDGTGKMVHGDFYHRSFESDIYTIGDTTENCNQDAEASFPNAGGMDDFYLLATEYVREALVPALRQINGKAEIFHGHTGVPTDGSVLLYQMIVDELEMDFGNGAGMHADCAGDIEAWARRTLNSNTQMRPQVWRKTIAALIQGNSRIQWLLNQIARHIAQADAAVEKLEVRLLAEGAAASAIDADGDGTEGEIEIANFLALRGQGFIRHLMADRRLEEAACDFADFTAGSQAIVTASQGLVETGDDTPATLADFAQLMADKIAALKTAQDDFDNQLQSVHSSNEQQKRDELDQWVVGALIDLAAAQGRGDIVREGKQKLIDTFGNDAMADVLQEVADRQAPMVTSVQHFFDNIYSKAADGDIATHADTNWGNVVNATDSARMRHFCHGEAARIDAIGMGYSRDMRKTCWLNIRNNTTEQMTNATSGFVLRVFGSADLIEVDADLYSQWIGRDDQAEIASGTKTIVETYHAIFDVRKDRNTSGTGRTYSARTSLNGNYTCPNNVVTYDNLHADYVISQHGAVDGNDITNANYRTAVCDSLAEHFAEHNPNKRTTDVTLGITGSNYYGSFDIRPFRAVSGNADSFARDRIFRIKAIRGQLKADFADAGNARSSKDITTNENGDVDATDVGAGDSAYTWRESDAARYRVTLVSPIVLDFLSIGRMSSLSALDGVKFDLDGDGKLDNTGWIAGREGAFLVLDRNGNGLIDDGTELFGDATPMKDGSQASNGYHALAQYDSNKDGRIDKRDGVFGKLRLWFDHNADGISQPDELTTLGAKEVTAVDVTHEDVPAVAQGDKGNQFRWQSRFHGPSSCPEEGCRSYDVYFGTSYQLGAK